MAIGAQTLFLFYVPYKFQKFLHTLQHRFTIITFACTIPTKALCQLSNHIQSSDWKKASAILINYDSNPKFQRQLSATLDKLNNESFPIFKMKSFFSYKKICRQQRAKTMILIVVHELQYKQHSPNTFFRG